MYGRVNSQDSQFACLGKCQTIEAQGGFWASQNSRRRLLCERLIRTCLLIATKHFLVSAELQKFALKYAGGLIGTIFAP